jgi:hypothetical protein
MALGWAHRPQLTADEMVELVRSSAETVNGCLIIDPVAFEAAVLSP